MLVGFIRPPICPSATLEQASSGKSVCRLSCCVSSICRFTQTNIQMLSLAINFKSVDMVVVEAVDYSCWWCTPQSGGGSPHCYQDNRVCVMTRCQIWGTIELHKNTLRVVKMVLNT